MRIVINSCKTCPFLTMEENGINSEGEYHIYSCAINMFDAWLITEPQAINGIHENCRLLKEDVLVTKEE